MTMKNQAYALFLLLVISACTKKSAETSINSTDQKEEESIATIGIQSEPDTIKGSIKAKAEGIIQEVPVSIHYHSPAVRGRIIWGGLVALDKVWVTGAHMATAIEFPEALTINNTQVPAGKYALFTIPSQEQWTVIINSNWQQHLADEYNEKEDVLRFTVSAEPQETNQERLRYFIEGNQIKMHWEKVLISIPVSR